MSEQLPLPEDQMMQWITAKWITKPIHVVVELGIPDLLRDGPQSIEALAEKTDTHAPTLFRVLRALSAVGIFVETSSRVFGPTPLSRCLLPNALGPIARMFLSPWHDNAWEGLHHTAKTGEPGFDHMFGRPSFEWFEKNPDQRAILDQGQGSKARGFARAAMEVMDFSNVKTICDIGGGQAVFLTHFLAQYPNIMGYVADLPGSVPSANQVIAKANLGNRCKAIPYDFHNQAPPECDLYFLVNILHDWEDETCIRILKNITRAMNADSSLWIMEYPLEPGPGFCVAKLLDMEVLVMSGGRERSIEEYQDLVSAAGLVVPRILPTKSGPVLMECVLHRK